MTEIFPQKRFRIIERKRIRALLTEMNLQQTDYFNQKTINQVGQQLGATYFLTGDIVEITLDEKKRSILLASIQNKIVELTVEARLISIATGEVIALARWSGKEKSSKKRALVAVTDDHMAVETLILHALKKAAKSKPFRIGSITYDGLAGFRPSHFGPITA